MHLVRTQIYLEPEQHQSLQEEARKKGISMAELIRQVVARHLESNRHPTAKEYLLDIIGLFHDPAPDVSEQHDRYLGEALAHENHG